ncbi:MAG: phosphatidate cytidylyltransferase [Candidatus Coproplasma sp.]
MKKRVITGILYIVVMLGLLVMKIFIPPTETGVEFGALGVDILFTLISVIGAYEFTRAVGEHKQPGDGGISRVQRGCVLITCALIIPVFSIVKMLSVHFAGVNGHTNAAPIGGPALIALLTVTSLGAMVTASMTVFDHDRSDLKSTAYSLMCILYCGVLVSVIPNINHMIKHSSIAITMLFVIVPCVDTFAFFFGSLFGKMLPLKLAPSTSPNKTVIGAVGGVIGGIFAAMLVWVCSEFLGFPAFDYVGSLPKWLVLIIISIPTSILAQLGDLFESAVKRGCGVKDMGNILPGHGGVLDRFDSMIFAAVSIVVCFMVI